jgi:hypothetical protein
MTALAILDVNSAVGFEKGSAEREFASAASAAVVRALLRFFAGDYHYVVAPDIGLGTWLRKRASRLMFWAAAARRNEQL